MGTRADFYVKRVDTSLEWLGSIAWDGQEIGNVADATSDQDYRQKLSEFFAPRNDVTLPAQGWPWPWRDSRLTDCAYVFIPGLGVVTRRGDDYPGTREADYKPDDGKADYVLLSTGGPIDAIYRYPDMTDRQNVDFGGPRSGLIVV